MGDCGRVGDSMKQDAPHCHAPIHPAAPVPTPVPHPAKPLKIIGPGAITVKANSKSVSVMGDMSEPCMLPSCVPAGPGMCAKGSLTVFAVGRPVMRKGDLTAHVSCVAPIPSPVGKLISPCSSDVKVGG